MNKYFEVEGTSAVKYVFAGNQRIARIAAAGTRYFHQDHLGSATVVTNEVGADVEGSEYLPFGGQRSHIGNVQAPYKFTDQELDASTGLYNYDARLYDSGIGRFVSADSLVQFPFKPQSLNRYSYTLNNPLIYVDPSGHSISPDVQNPGRDLSDAKEVAGVGKGSFGSSDGDDNHGNEQGGFEIAQADFSAYEKALKDYEEEIERQQQKGLQLSIELGISFMGPTLLGLPPTLAPKRRGSLKNASGKLDDAASAARKQPHQREITKHANMRLQTRDKRVTKEALEKAITRGQREFDSTTGVTVHNLPASQSPTNRGVTAVTNHRGGVISVIDRGRKFNP